MDHFSFQRFFAYLGKESKQILRDPSTFLIAFVLPLLMIFIFGYGFSLDANKIRIGIVIEDTANEARSLCNAFLGTPYFESTTGYSSQALQRKMTAGRLRGIVTIPQDFSKNIQRGIPTPLQIIVDGGETNTAKFVLNYAQGVINNWLDQRTSEKKHFSQTPIEVVPRFWFNPDLKSRNVLLPGSIAIIMSLIGTLLTALVIAREWERGTMEVIMSTPIHISEMLLGKLIPYFLLGLGSMTLCVLLSTLVFKVPFRGSIFVLFLATSVFLLAALAQGFLISSATRNQFVSSQIAIMLGFLPAFVLSGFVFEISSMPWPIQILTYILPPRYFVTILQSSFLSGTSWELVWPNVLAMLLIAAFFFGLTVRKTVKRLD